MKQFVTRADHVATFLFYRRNTWDNTQEWSNQLKKWLIKETKQQMQAFYAITENYLICFSIDS